MDENLREFLVESREALDALDHDLADLARSPGDRETLAAVLRRIHTIKGNCGFFGFDRLERLTHVGEGLLARLRDRDLGIDASVETALLGLVDAIRAALADIERTGEEGAEEFGGLLEALARLRGRPAEARADAAGPASGPPPLAGEGRQPIGRHWSRLPRLVQDLARRCGRKVRLELEGHAIEFDRRVLEAIRDPVTHLVRNAVDHGIESPGDRIRAGKPEEGRIVLRAYREGAVTGVEMRDDGAGIDPARIREKARELGLVPAEALAKLGDDDILQLVFHPGLSTAEEISLTSGRGVGMDVVRTNVEAIGGAVHVHSRAGEGTTVRIRVPFTPADGPATTAHPIRVGG